MMKSWALAKLAASINWLWLADLPKRIASAMLPENTVVRWGTSAIC